MAYVKTNWVNDTTPINASNLNKIENQLEALTNMIYPVGSIYLSVNDTNPSTIFGGTWEQIKDRFLLSAGDTYSGGSTGGNATINLNHTHGSGSLIASLNFEGGGIRYYYDSSTQPAYNYTEGFSTNETSGSGTMYGGTRVIGSTGAGLSNSQSILPPYLAVYVWKRVS